MKREFNQDDFRDPVRDALTAVIDKTDGKLTFNLEKASVLEPTPDKPNTARSEVKADYGGIVVSKMVVVVFAPRDGTGSEDAENGMTVQNLEFGLDMPVDGRCIPRFKLEKGIHREIALGLCALDSGTDAEPALFANHLQLLTIDPQHPDMVVNGHYLGQPERDMHTSVHYGRDAKLVSNFTCGENANGQRFGDPHAVFNQSPSIWQVAAFMGFDGTRPRLVDELCNALDTAAPSSDFSEDF